jgi:Uma2 family endonuclease
MNVDLYDELIPLPRQAVRFPVELRPPPGFRVEDPLTWPNTPGRLEYVQGRLLLMPPCGDIQQVVCPPLLALLWSWAESHPGFVVAGNEAGMLLDGEVRGADAALWVRETLGPRTGRYCRTPPLLAVEVGGQDEDEDELRHKARWYLEHGVRVVWLVLPDTREVLVLTQEGESRHGPKDRLPATALLPGLEPAVDRFFVQLNR